jgi:hypothetical protein
MMGIPFDQKMFSLYEILTDAVEFVYIHDVNIKSLNIITGKIVLNIYKFKPFDKGITNH